MKKLFTSLLAVITIGAVMFSTAMLWPTQANTAQNGGLITANGKASLSVAPDVAWINVGVTIEKPTVDLAQAEVTKKIDALLASIKALGVSDDHIKTTNYAINPTMVWDQQSNTNKLTGYTVTHNLEIQIVNIKESAKLLDAVVKAGGNQVSGIRFGLSNQGETYAKVLEQAVINAKISASAMGKGIGVKELKPVSIKEQPTYAVPYYETAMVKSADMTSAEPTIMSGTIEINAEVIVEFSYE